VWPDFISLACLVLLTRLAHTQMSMSRLAVVVVVFALRGCSA
jgi:hypothetical protein